jgi:hypothetical protein
VLVLLIARARCQDLMELFIQYQIPADQLSYEGDRDVDVTVKVSIVQTNVDNVKEMIAEAKRIELKEAAEKAAKEAAERAAAELAARVSTACVVVVVVLRVLAHSHTRGVRVATTRYRGCE